MGLNERILIIEDMQFIADAARDELEGAGQTVVGHATDLVTARRLIDETDYTVAVVDGSLGKGGQGKGGCVDGIVMEDAIKIKNERRKHDAPGSPEIVVVAFTTSLPQATTYGNYYVGKSGSRMFKDLVSTVTDIPRPNNPSPVGK